jgi:hypothetical protein
MKSIDERIDVLTTIAEVLHQQVQKLSHQVEELRATVARHEDELVRFRSVFVAERRKRFNENGDHDGWKQKQ